MTDPTGYLSQPLATLRAMIAATTAFQDWVEADDAAAALASVSVITTPRPAPAKFCIVDFDDLEREREAVQNVRKFRQVESDLLAYFRADVADGLSDLDATYTFTNKVGAIWEELEKDAGKYEPVTLAIRRISFVIRPTRIVAEERSTAGDYYEAGLRIGFTRQP